MARPPPPPPSRSFEDDRRKGPLGEKHEGAPGAVIGGQGRTGNAKEKTEEYQVTGERTYDSTRKVFKSKIRQLEGCRANLQSVNWKLYNEFTIRQLRRGRVNLRSDNSRVVGRQQPASHPASLAGNSQQPASQAAASRQPASQASSNNQPASQPTREQLAARQAARQAAASQPASQHQNIG